MTTAKTLVLIPSAFELGFIRQHPALADFSAETATTVVLEECGVGLVQAAVRTAQLIEQQKPQHVVLLGIAGTYDEQRASVGHAYLFAAVSCFGIGVGQGANFRPIETTALAAFGQANREIALHIPDTLRAEIAEGSLITVAAVSSNATEVDSIRTHYSSGIAEDMEGFSVATACEFRAIPCSIIRGISNIAGQRNKTSWQIDAALSAACKLFVRSQKNQEWKKND